MKVLKFKDTFSPYVEGDVAGIDDDKLAEKLIKDGVAVAYNKGAEAKSVKEPAKDKMVNAPKVEK